MRDVAPEQEVEFDFVARAYSPRAERIARGSSNEPTASVADLGEMVLSTVALGVTTDVCKYLVVAAAKSGRTQLSRVLKRQKVTLETEVPELPAAQVELVRRRAVAAAIEHGLAADQAEEFGAALVKSWPPPA